VRVHGRLLAADVGELAGVSGTTIGQWARRGYIRSSQSEGEPRVYSVEDVGEAAIVADLLARDEPRPRIVLREDGRTWALGARGWQQLAVLPALDEVRLRLHHSLS